MLDIFFIIVLICGPETLLTHSIRCSHFIPPENINISGVSRGSNVGTLARNGLINHHNYIILESFFQEKNVFNINVCMILN